MSALSFSKSTTIGEARKSSVEFSRAARFVERFTGKMLPPDFGVVEIYTSKKSWHGDVSKGQMHFGSNIPQKKIPNTISHEFVHVLDEGIPHKMKAISRKQPDDDFLTVFNQAIVVRLYKEGRAVFVASEYTDRAFENSMQLKFALVALVSPIAVFAGALAGAIGGIIGMAASAAVASNPGKYVLGTSALRKIEKKVGDAKTAFEISSTKVPAKWGDLLQPLKFYKDEIALALQEKKQSKG